MAGRCRPFLLGFTAILQKWRTDAALFYEMAGPFSRRPFLRKGGPPFLSAVHLSTGKKRAVDWLDLAVGFLGSGRLPFFTKWPALYTSARPNYAP